MTLTNHILTGALLGRLLPLPLAIPAALASHFLLDIAPHFGFRTAEERIQHVQLMRSVIAVDAAVGIALAIWLVLRGNALWLLPGFIAYSPDVFWVYRFTVEEHFGSREVSSGNRFIQFHMRIQQFERMWGLVIEIAYGCLMFALLQ